MKFTDQMTIDVRAGDGGNGLTSFRREKYIPHGGPDGGDGGDGGSVYVRAEVGLNHLGHFLHQRFFKAANGGSGQSRGSSGAAGPDINVAVPPGTIIYDADTNEIIRELLDSGQSVLVANGGRRGLGNPHFKSSVNRAPRRSTNGAPGEARSLKLELRLIADIGLVGKPNAGKSSLLNRLTSAQAKVGEYIFTTLNPVLGVVRAEYDNHYRAYTIADIPGLIEGAEHGEGLGFFFLRHVLRTRLLLHLVDAGADDVLADIDQVEHTLYEYDARLRTHPRWLVLSKSDVHSDTDIAELVKRVQAHSPLPCYTSSALTGDGAHALSDAIADFLPKP